MGSHHQTWHAVSEEDQSPAAAVWRLPARDARQEEEGEQCSSQVFSLTKHKTVGDNQPECVTSPAV